jgi:hypothetical protein
VVGDAHPTSNCLYVRGESDFLHTSALTRSSAAANGLAY